MQVEKSIHRFPWAPVRALLLAGAAGAGVGFLLFLLTVQVLSDYGLAVFLAAPFLMGVASGLVLGAQGFFNGLSLFFGGVLGLAIAAALLLALAFEGAICLAMAAPLAVPLNLFGVLIGAWMLEGRRRPPMLAFALLVLPLSLGADHAMDEFPIRPLVTTIEIDAPPDVVWRQVIGFAELPPAHETIFKIGIAHPIGARIEGRGVGAVRHCEFSTGPFVEPITAWEPPTRLAFDVASQPDPMHEWSPYRQVNAPHLKHGLKSHRGEFLLTALPGGRTRLQGTTWYEVRMSPHPYWRAWSDYLIRGIHLRVLRHVKQTSEQNG